MDKELIILEQIQNNPHVNQRDLATIAQASLGMTNAILKRFAEKGLITIKKVNNRNIRYALTPQGIDEITHRSWNYFKRTIKNVIVYQDAIREIVKQAKTQGYKEIVLRGESDMAFIIEHICHKLCIPFVYDEKYDYGNSKLCFNFYSESKDIDMNESDTENSFSLNRLILKL